MDMRLNQQPNDRQQAATHQATVAILFNTTAPPTTTIAMAIKFIDRILSEIVVFEFIIVVAVLLSIVIGLVYEFIGVVSNITTIASFVSIILKFIAVLVPIINGLIHDIQCIIISQLYDIITIKIGFNCMIFDRVCNDINRVLFTTVGMEFMAQFVEFLANVIEYRIGFARGNVVCFFFMCFFFFFFV